MMRKVRGYFDSLPIDQGGHLPKPATDYFYKGKQWAKQNWLPITLFGIGLVIA